MEILKTPLEEISNIFEDTVPPEIELTWSITLHRIAFQ